VPSAVPRFKLFPDTILTVDYVLFSTPDVTLNINPNEVSDTKWVSKSELEELFKDSCTSLRRPPSLCLSVPSDHRDPHPALSFTPWFKLIAQSFLYQWWDTLLEESAKAGKAAADVNVLRPLVSAQYRDQIHRMA
jgi:isopentenyl-diphosphate delta-isomerase